MGINFHCSQVTLRHEGLPLFLRTSSRLIEWKRTNCKMITLNKIYACAGMTTFSFYHKFNFRHSRMTKWSLKIIREVKSLSPFRD